MTCNVSVLIPTHNPDLARLERVLDALQGQSLGFEQWELIVVDNASTDSNLSEQLELSWHPNYKIIREERLGLTWARLAGINEAQGKYIVFVDDDNILQSDYLEQSLLILEENQDLGAIGGKVLGDFEAEPVGWQRNFDVCLALRDLGEQVSVSEKYEASLLPVMYPACAPIGAGMALRLEAAKHYVSVIGQNESPLVLDRCGQSLSSGGDNDLVFCVIKKGWRVGYFPQLVLQHIIPKTRITKEYLAKVNYASSRSWMHVLNKHEALTWPKIPKWTTGLRKLKAYFAHRAWKNSSAYIKWRGACGMIDGLGEVEGCDTHTLSDIAKLFGLGKIAYYLFHVPKSILKDWILRDPFHRFLDLRAKKAMQNSVIALNPLSSDSTTFDIHFLTGQKFWYQTLYCAYSMMQHSKLSLRPIIYDDGTLDSKCIDDIKTVLPMTKFVSLKEIEERLDEFLPESLYPMLRARRLEYPHLRKLTDIHVGQKGWKLVLDSDMLFFRRPDFLIDWLKAPQQPCHMLDIATFYGYSKSLMEQLTQTAIAERINVGICGLNSEELDWEQLEYWTKVLMAKEGKHYTQEQALVAMLLAGKSCAIAAEDQYIVKPDKAEVVEPKAVLHHYVADSKPWYFHYGWRHIFKNQIKD